MDLIIDKIERVSGEKPEMCQLHIRVVMKGFNVLATFMCVENLKSTAPIPDDLEARCEARIRSLFDSET